MFRDAINVLFPLKKVGLGEEEKFVNIKECT
jgi:hypothetical protein